MKIHREGFKTLIVVSVFLLAFNFGAYCILSDYKIILTLLAIVSISFFVFIASFFRNPERRIDSDESHVISPCDGKVVVIEQTDETEFLKDRRIQVSIFMSPLNVHINRNPIGGKVEYVKYHPGKYLVAWHPKSSIENERNTVVIKNNYSSILFRQIAGKVARKIVSYVSEGQSVSQGNEMGFIKFGSRVDVFLPPDAELKVSLNQNVRGGISVLAVLKK